MRERLGLVAAGLSGLLGGALGGALAGLSEAVLIAATSGASDEYWLFPYAVVSYGLLGAGLGGTLGILLWLAGRLGARSVAATPYAAGVALAFFFIAVIVGRYHVAQRIFAEQLPVFTPQGIAVHAGLALAAGVLAALLWLLARRSARSAAGPRGALVVLVVMLAAATAAAMLMRAPASVPLRQSASPKAKGRPNVILIVVDTLRADALGVYGADKEASPRIDRFASRAVLFTDAAAQSSWTRPSIATILTSLHPTAHGAIHKMDPLPEGVTTLAEAFHSEGYWTAGFVSNINVAPIFNFQQGFDEYQYLAPAFYFAATDSATRLAIYKILRLVRERFFGDRIYFYHYYQDAQVVNQAALAWLEARPPQPFFLFLHYMDPHDPYFEIPYNGHGIARVTDPDPPHQRRDEMARLYREDVAYLDRYVGDFFERLEQMGLFAGSTVVLTADHGEEFLDHGGWWHGTTLYQEQIHVPLLIKRPNEAQPGLLRRDPARSVDIAPTLMATGGAVAPRAFQGRDLFGPIPPEAAVRFAEEDLEGNQLNALRVGDWKIVSANPGNPRGLPPLELFDLSRDPRETDNLAGVEAARVQAMLRQMGEVRAATSRLIE